MDRTSDWVLFGVVAVLFAAAAVAAYRTAGKRALLGVWVASAVLLGVLGFMEWQRLPVKETPLIAYALVATVPTLAASVFVNVTASRKQSVVVQFVGASFLCWVLMPGMLLLGTYALTG